MGCRLRTGVLLLAAASSFTPAMALSDPNPFSNIYRLCKALSGEGFKLGELTGRVWSVNAGSSGFCDVSDLTLLNEPPGATAISYIVQGTVDQPNEIKLELNSYHRSILAASKRKYLTIMQALFRNLGLTLPDELVRAIRQESPWKQKLSYGLATLEVGHFGVPPNPSLDVFSLTIVRTEEHSRPSR